jgi:hypothetical protein
LIIVVFPYARIVVGILSFFEDDSRKILLFTILSCALLSTTIVFLIRMHYLYLKLQMEELKIITIRHNFMDVRFIISQLIAIFQAISWKAIAWVRIH